MGLDYQPVTGDPRISELSTGCVYKFGIVFSQIFRDIPIPNIFEYIAYTYLMNIWAEALYIYIYIYILDEL